MESIRDYKKNKIEIAINRMMSSRVLGFDYWGSNLYADFIDLKKAHVQVFKKEFRTSFVKQGSFRVRCIEE